MARANWFLDWVILADTHVDKVPRNQSAGAYATATSHVIVQDVTTNGLWYDQYAGGGLYNYSEEQNANATSTDTWDRYLSLPLVVPLSRGDEYRVILFFNFEATSSVSTFNYSPGAIVGSGNSALASVSVNGAPGQTRLESVEIDQANSY